MTGSSKQTTTTTNNAPWSGAQPALNTALQGAQSLYNNKVGEGVYTGSTVVPWDKQTVAGQNAITNAANANIGGKGLSGQYQGVIDSGGYNDAQLGALNNTKTLANSNWSVSPELQKIIDQTNADANTNVSLANSAGGRYGSGSGNAAIADAVSKNTNNLLYSDLNNFQTRKDAANSNLFNMGQTGFGNLGTAYTGLQAPAQSLMQVGNMQEDLATRQLNDKLRIFNDQQNRPWENLARLNAIASGAGQLGGTQTTATPGQNPFLQGLGYAATGAGLLGSFF
jgi:hypothetical protein